MREWLLIGMIGAVAGLSGCTGEILMVGDDDSMEEDASLSIASPAAGTTFERGALGDLGRLVALVDLEAETTGPIVRVVFEQRGAGELAEVIGDDFAVTAQIGDDGTYVVDAIGFDSDGVELARASVDFEVIEPTVADCFGWLDLYNLNYELGPNRQGVTDPVTITTPINGMSYRYGSNESPRSTFFMSCELGKSLAQASYYLRTRDIVEVVDYGVYNYRCIGGGTPPDCPNGVSQHAYAKAIDVAGVTSGVGEYYSVNDDWVIDADSESTCTAPTESEKDAFLHELICDLKSNGVWNIVLTPNYNDAHRNHFHVDLTTGADFIEYDALLDAVAGKATHHSHAQ